MPAKRPDSSSLHAIPGAISPLMTIGGPEPNCDANCV